MVSVFSDTLSSKCSSERRRREQIGTIILADSKADFVMTGEVEIIITVCVNECKSESREK